MTTARRTAPAAMRVRRRRMSSEANMCSVMVANRCSVVKNRGFGLADAAWRAVRVAPCPRRAPPHDPPPRPPQPPARRPAEHDGHRQRHAGLVLRPGRHVGAGAGIVDVGGMTAQPGRILGEDEEIARVEGVVSALRAQLDVPISIDTYRARVADAALRAGADIVNDHTGLTDPEMAATIAAHGAGLVVTHLSLEPKQPQTARHTVTVDDIAEFLVVRAEAAIAAGVDPAAILVDPGLGFGKDTATDLRTLDDLPRLAALGYPLLLAPSHKEVTAEPLGLEEASMEGTAAVVAV